MPDTPVIENAVQVLDRITAYDMWASGVVFVGKGQGDNRFDILGNQQGTQRYQVFLESVYFIPIIGKLFVNRNEDRSI